MNNVSLLKGCFIMMVQNSALVAMSGGVDSTVAALISIKEGLDCTGAMMKLYHGETDSEADARRAAERLGIPFHVFDMSECFAEEVITRFVDVYCEGRTPNPCVECNKRMKFGRLLEKAVELGKDYIVTGHYARVKREPGGRYILKKGMDNSKDQSYVLYSLTQKQLAAAQFPLGELTKKQVREIALGAGLENAQKNESQDICFIEGGDYAKFIEDYIGEPPRKGRFIDMDGNDLGENRGVVRYTIGQRRGLGLAMKYPPYVVEIRPEDNTVVIGRNDELYSKTFFIRDINLIPFEKIDSPIHAHVKIRYNHREQPARVHQIDDDSLLVEFEEPQRAITKGQAAVIYKEDVVIGGGTIV